MKLRSKLLLPGILLFVSVIALGCGGGGLSLKYSPLSNPDNVLTSVSPTKIKLLHFTDNRKGGVESTLVGGMQRNINGPVYDIKSQKGVAETIYEAIKSEMVRNGHKIVDSDEDIVMKGEIKTFWLRTEPNENNVDLIGEIAILVEVVNPDTGSSTFLGPYNSENREKRFLSPDSSSVMDRVLSTALSKLIKVMSSDAKLASALASK